MHNEILNDHAVVTLYKEWHPTNIPELLLFAPKFSSDVNSLESKHQL